MSFVYCEATLFYPDRTWVFGPPSRSRYALIFYILAIWLWGYPMYYFKVRNKVDCYSLSLSLSLSLKAIPLTLETMPLLHHSFWVGNILLWILFLWLKFGDPGYIKPDREAFEKAQKMV